MLLDEQHQPCGTAPRVAIHTEQTPLHLAFSSYLLDADGRLLLTRRALGKRAWPGVWTNSCCGHPRPGESLEDAVHRRVREELGLVPTGLRCVLPDFRYRAVDPGGVVENEFCPVFLATVAARELSPDVGEVAEWTWVTWSAAATAITAVPSVFSPWAVAQMTRLGPRPPD